MNKIRTRRWVFTLNNPTEDLGEFIDYLTNRVAVRYIVVGRETAPTTGTMHWQGFVEFQNPATFKQVQGRIPKAHIEPAKGSNRQNREYCIKSGDFMERGQLYTREATSDNAHEVITMIMEGIDPLTVALNNPNLASYIVKHYRALRDIYRDVKYRLDNFLHHKLMAEWLEEKNQEDEEKQAQPATLDSPATAPDKVQGCE